MSVPSVVVHLHRAHSKTFTLTRQLSAYRPSMSQQSVHLVYPMDFKDILNDPIKLSNYQIIDVREAHELDISSIKNAGVIHLPLSTCSEWTNQINDGHILDKIKPVLVFCRSGGRSLKIAKILGMSIMFIAFFDLCHSYVCSLAA